MTDRTYTILDCLENNRNVPPLEEVHKRIVGLLLSERGLPASLDDYYRQEGIRPVEFLGHQVEAHPAVIAVLEKTQKQLIHVGQLAAIQAVINQFGAYQPRLKVQHLARLKADWQQLAARQLLDPAPAQTFIGFHLSEHALGRAFDLNMRTNPHIIPPVYHPFIEAVKQIGDVDIRGPQTYAIMRQTSLAFQREYDFNLLQASWNEATTPLSEVVQKELESLKQTGFLDLPQPLVEGLLEAGATWGGHWLDSKDFMHFEVLN